MACVTHVLGTVSSQSEHSDGIDQSPSPNIAPFGWQIHHLPRLLKQRPCFSASDQVLSIPDLLDIALMFGILARGTSATSAPFAYRSPMGSQESKVLSPPKQELRDPVVSFDDTADDESEIHEDHLPTYAPTAIPSEAVKYRFTQCSPFAMVIVRDALDALPEGHGLYHISVGVNVWMPSCTVTTIRRGYSEAGHLVAQLELGLTTDPATVTVGSHCRPLNEVIVQRVSWSRSRIYRTLDGSVIKWKLGDQSWHASLGPQLLATFTPTLPRELTLEPEAHRYSDDIVVALVILMREYLTPRAKEVGTAARMFNYAPHVLVNHDN